MRYLRNTLLFMLNELMVFVALIICFPGLLPPKDRMDIVMQTLLFLCVSAMWWVMLAIAPLAFAIMWWATPDFGLNYWSDTWPWNIGHFAMGLWAMLVACALIVGGQWYIRLCHQVRRLDEQERDV